jgi:hypothetical protein
MADIALGSLERIIKVALKIKKAVRTVQQNEEECQALEKEVAIVIAILSPLQVMRAVTPAMTLALMGLEENIDSALELVRKCQEKHTFVHRLVTANDMARQLARVKADIHGNVTMCTFAITGQLAITVEYRTVTAHLLQLHQVRITSLHQLAHYWVGRFRMYGPCVPGPRSLKLITCLLWEPFRSNVPWFICKIS